MISKQYALETLHLTEEEFEKLRKWHEKIVKKRGSRYFGCIGGEISFVIIPTSIGEIIEARCGKKKITLRKLS